MRKIHKHINISLNFSTPLLPYFEWKHTWTPKHSFSPLMMCPDCFRKRFSWNWLLPFIVYFQDILYVDSHISNVNIFLINHTFSKCSVNIKISSPAIRHWLGQASFPNKSLESRERGSLTGCNVVVFSRAITEQCQSRHMSLIPTLDY